MVLVEYKGFITGISGIATLLVLAMFVVNFIGIALDGGVANKRAEKIGKKIREARLEKIPYLLVVGANEEESKTVSVRKRGEDGDLGSMELNTFISKICEEIRTKSLEQMK